MPAQEDTYRSQHALHITFAVSSIAMAVSIIWMIGADHFREWKNVQRDFLKMDAAKARRETQIAGSEGLKALKVAVSEAKRAAAKKVAEADTEIAKVLGKKQLAEQDLSFLKASRDSIASFIDIAKEKGDKIEIERLTKELEGIDTRQLAQQIEFETHNENLKAAEKMKAKANEEVTKAEKELNDKVKEKEKLENKGWTTRAAIRSSPILDMLAPATKIEQVVLSDLPINLSFKGVPRFDRCTTCHKGVDQVTKDGAAYEKKVVEDNSNSPFRGAFATHSRPELFAAATSKHPREKFGCTICHMGQGSGTSFVFASHTPNSHEKEAEWHKKYEWEEVHHWPFPMNRSRFVESGCIKCHTHVVDLENADGGNAAPKVTRGYNLVRQYGCFGCHEITGFKNARMIGPDLRVEPQTPEEKAKAEKAEKEGGDPAGRMRKVGPSLRQLPQKTTPEWVHRWIKQPNGFRPKTRMPQFYGLSNNLATTRVGSHDFNDTELSSVELHAIVKYLYASSSDFLAEVADVKSLPADEFRKLVARGSELDAKLQAILKKTEKPSAAEQRDRDKLKSELETVKTRITYRDLPEWVDSPVAIDPKAKEQTDRGKSRFIERGCLACHSHKDVPVADNPLANADFGPDLSNVAVKLLTPEGKPNAKWLFNWLKNPLVYHATSFMPNLQLKDDEAADIAAWLLSVEGGWVKDPGESKLDNDLVNSLVELFLQKSMTLKEASKTLNDGVPADKLETIRGDERMLAAPMKADTKLLYLGKKTISRMGCFGCHDIPGFETAKPIGTELASWGVKSRMDPDKLDFAHITEYLEHVVPESQKNDDFKLFAAGMEEHKGESFLWGKLRDPRSYDYNKLKSWEDKLRMPRFPFADNPDDVEAVMTFVLGLVADDGIAPQYRFDPQNGPKRAKIDGAKAIAKFNCAGCHMLEMPTFTFDVKKTADDLPPAAHPQDFKEIEPDQRAMAERTKTGDIKKTTLASIRAMLVQNSIADRAERIPQDIPKDADELYLDLWEPAKVNDSLYYIGDRFTIKPDALDRTLTTPAKGGQFAELLVTHLMKKTNKSNRDMWSFVPPPLVREGYKAQPAWLHDFLLDPFEIRPAVALRMPKFNMTSAEASAIAGYFAAVDGVPFPHQEIAERESGYLAARELSHPNYLREAWGLMTAVPQPGSTVSLCINCHNVGDKKVSGGKPEERGPNLWLTPDRIRPDFLRLWIAAPNRLVPYTGMPKNFPLGPLQYQTIFKGETLDQITGVRDALINYHSVLHKEVVNRDSTQTPSGEN